MKSKCSFILKASLSLVLALLMLFGTVATSVAAVVDDMAESGAQADLAETGAETSYNTSGTVRLYYDNSVTNWSKVYFRIGRGDYNQAIEMSPVVTGSKLYTCTVSGWNDYVAFNFANSYGWTGDNNSIYENHIYTAATVYKKFALNGTYYFKGTDATVGSANNSHYGACVGASGNGTDGDTTASNYTTYSKTVTRSAVTNGNVQVDYINTSRTAASIANGNTSSSATALIGTDITVTAAPSGGYYTKTIGATNSSNTSSSRSNTLTTTLTGNSPTAISATFDIPRYYLGGLGASWTTVEMTSQGDGWYKATKTLTKDKIYSAENTNYFGYKIVDEQNDKYYRSNTAVTTTKTKESPLKLISTDGNNSSLQTLNNASGSTTYVFYYKPSTNQLAIYYPQQVSYNKNGVTTTSFPTATTYVTYDTAIGSAPTPTPAATGYTFEGWKKSGVSTAFDFENTKITSATTINAQWSEVTGGIALTAMTNGANSTVGGHIEDGSGATITSLSDIGISTKGTAVSVASGSAYSFIGWTVEGDNASHIKLYTNEACTTEYTAGGTDATIYIKTDGTAGLNTSNAIVKAHFQKNTDHYISLYNTTIFDRGHWVVLSSPPQTVKVTNPAGKVTTYTYAGGTKAQRGENTVTSGGSTDNTKTATGTYYEGNKLLVHAGDKIEMTYSALASSDIISGVFYNNSIRYTTELEDDNLFCLREYKSGGYGARDTGSGHSYHDLIGGAEVPDDDVDFFYDDNYGTNNGIYDGHALYANANYYKDVTAEIISAQTNYAAAVDEDVHTVTWTAGDQDYLNIDIELASKKQVHFSDAVNTVINSIHTDNYYTIGEDVSPSTTETASLSIKAKGDSTQTNTITKANIKFYYCDNNGNYINPATGKKVTKANRVELTGSDASLSVQGSAESISNSGPTASSSFYYIDGKMPATDVMVDLDLTVTYTLKLRSKIQSDTIDSKTGFGQVATLQIGSTSNSANNTYTSGVQIATGTCDSGDNITLKASSITSGYMFIGWFEGTSSAPDLSKEPLSTNATFSYKPTKSIDVWAVGTRSLYINGSRYLFSGTRTDWQNENVLMKYDPDKQLYYHEIDAAIFAAANSKYETKENTNTWVGGNDNSGTGGNNYGYKVSDSKYYWMSYANSEHGNATFQILDTATGNDNNTNKTVWANVHTFRTTANGITVGKALFRNDGGDGAVFARKNGQGFLNFNLTDSAYAGYDTPLRIYFNPANGNLTAEATPIYPHIYLSNGYKGLDVAKDGTPSDVYIKVNNGTARRNNITSESSYTANLKFIGNGWDPNYEGHVSDISVSARNATLTLTKTTSSANYKVSSFLVYNMTKGTVKAYPATSTGTTNQYSCNTIKTSDDDSLYIIPILEYIGSNKKMTVVVDSSSLDYKQWGRLVACYAWNGSGDNNGPYPGQPMVPSDDGNSWKATFECSSLTGITLSNYVNDVAGTTFLDTSGTLGTVSDHTTGTASGGRVNVYNHIDSDDNNYDRTNFKAQTYDYREPIAYFNNQPAGASNTVLTFALKSGDSKLLSWRDSELRALNILTYKQEHPTWSDIDFEYLTDSTGTKYSDLNGYALPDKPTASFYIAGKAMAIYNDNVMTRVFSSGNYSDSDEINSTTYPDAKYQDYKGYSSGEIDMNFAVQWYIYDASGKFITSCLSAGFADKNKTNNDMTVVTQRLRDLGYAVEGRSAKICYDMPRYCFTNSGGLPSSGSGFDVYRFTGQWYMDNEYKKANVYAKVGIMTDNGEEIAESSSAPYGSASVSVNNSLCTIAGYSGTDTTDEGVDYGYTTVIDGDKGAITLTASETNFIGWYHYNSDKKLELDTKERIFRPSYSADSTYIAMYEAKVNYSYPYVGREGGTKYYNVGSDTHLNETEIAAGNKVATDSTHTSEAGSKSPGSAGIGIFKKTVTFTTPVTTSMLSNPNEYQLIVNNCTITNATYQITAKYRNASGDLVDYVTPAKEYNQVVDLTTLNSGNSLIQWTGHKFIGWYEYDVNSSTVGQLLSTQANYGMRMVKQQTIVAVYQGDSFGISVPDDTDWHAYVDDNEVNYEMTSATAGTVYNDAVIRVRKNDSNTPTLAANGKVGMIIVEDGGTNQTINTEKLAAYANALKTSGKTGNVSVSGGTARVTNFFTSASNVNNFGRADFAAKYSFGSVSGHKYQIYAYYYDGTSYHFNTTATTGTYN